MTSVAAAAAEPARGGNDGPLREDPISVLLRIILKKIAEQHLEDEGIRSRTAMTLGLCQRRQRTTSLSERSTARQCGFFCLA